jgi:nucleotide-binding universal stress UspA family protein
MMLFEKILVAVDGSDHSVRALEEALEIAKLVGGKITLVNVYWTGSSHIITQYQDYKFQTKRKKGESILEDCEKRAKAVGVHVDALLLAGDVVDQIVKTAKEGDFDLVVVGARGLSRVKGLLQGSVSCGVTSNAPCPVLVAR